MNESHIKKLVTYAEKHAMSIIEWRINQKYVKDIMQIPGAEDLQYLMSIPVNTRSLYRFNHHFFPVELHTDQGVVRMLRDDFRIMVQSR